MFVGSQKRCTFVAKLQLFREIMSNRGHKNMCYFRNLWAALTGQDPFQQDRARLEEWLAKCEANMRGLQDMYYSAVEQWRQKADENAKLVKEIGNYQALVETLRSTIRDKESVIGEYAKSWSKQTSTTADEKEEVQIQEKQNK